MERGSNEGICTIRGNGNDGSKERRWDERRVCLWMKHGKKRNINERSDESKDGFMFCVGYFAALERLDEE